MYVCIMKHLKVEHRLLLFSISQHFSAAGLRGFTKARTKKMFLDLFEETALLWTSTKCCMHTRV